MQSPHQSKSPKQAQSGGTKKRTKKTSYNFWTEEEKAQLLEQIILHQNAGRIQWQKVAEALPNRTPNQCKTMYSVQFVNKQGIRVVQSKRDKWDDYQMVRLIAFVLTYGEQWQLIQENYFHDLTPEILQAKYAKIAPRITQGIDIVRHYSATKSFAISPKDARFYLTIFKGFQYRLLLFQFVINKQLHIPTNPPIIPKDLDDMRRFLEIQPDYLELGVYKKIEHSVNLDELVAALQEHTQKDQ